MKKKKETLMEAAKETVGLGILSGAGMGAMGALGGIGAGLGVKMGPVTGAVGAGLSLANVGRMAKTGMTVAGTMAPSKPKKGKQQSIMDKFW